MNFKTVIKITAVQPKKICDFKKMDKKYKMFDDLKLKEYMSKWNLDTNLKVLTFNFQGNHKFIQSEEIISDIFQSEITSKYLGFQMPTDIKNQKYLRIEIEAVPCTILSMDFFDRIYEKGITLHDGTIRKCFEDYLDDIVIADELRSMLLMKESENYTLYQEEERTEFLFRIFRHLCIGGVLNQYEDNIEPYISTSKTMYKDLLRVGKLGDSKKTTIISQVFKVVVFDGDRTVYPSTKCHENDFSYIIINLAQHEVTIMQHAQ